MSEPMDYSARNPLVALAHAENWRFKHDEDSDITAALHQTTGIPFMLDYVHTAYEEGVLTEKTKQRVDELPMRELMRLFKMAWDRYGLIQTSEDAPVAVNAGPRTDAPAWRYTKQPVTVDAYRLPLSGEPVAPEFEAWCEAVGFEEWECDRDEGLIIHTLEGDMRADPGDWIIKGVKGEFYPCKNDIFIATYKPEAQPEALRLDLSHLTPEQLADWKHQFQTARPDAKIVYMGKGEGEEFIIGDTTYKPEDAPEVATAPQDGSKVTGYRKLSDDDIAQMNVFKSVSRSFAREIDTYKAHLEGVLNGSAMLSAEQAQQHRDALRWLAIARTDVQTACMAACRAVAKPENDC